MACIELFCNEEISEISALLKNQLKTIGGEAEEIAAVYGKKGFIGTISNYANFAGTIRLRKSLENIEKIAKQYNKEISIDLEKSLDKKVSSTNFYFRHDDIGGIHAKSRILNPGKEHPEQYFYDNIMVVNENPVVFCMRVIKPKRGFLKKLWVKPEEYSRKLLPVKEAYNAQSMGYIVVIEPNIYKIVHPETNDDVKISSQKIRGLEPLKDFEKKGGILVPFPFTRDEYEDTVFREITKAGIEVRSK